MFRMNQGSNSGGTNSMRQPRTQPVRYSTMEGRSRRNVTSTYDIRRSSVHSTGTAGTLGNSRHSSVHRPRRSPFHPADTATNVTSTYDIGRSSLHSTGTAGTLGNSRHYSVHRPRRSPSHPAATATNVNSTYDIGRNSMHSTGTAGTSGNIIHYSAHRPRRPPSHPAATATNVTSTYDIGRSSIHSTGTAGTSGNIIHYSAHRPRRSPSHSAATDTNPAPRRRSRCQSITQPKPFKARSTLPRSPPALKDKLFGKQKKSRGKSGASPSSKSQTSTTPQTRMSKLFSFKRSPSSRSPSTTSYQSPTPRMHSASSRSSNERTAASRRSFWSKSKISHERSHERSSRRNSKLHPTPVLSTIPNLMGDEGPYEVDGVEVEVLESRQSNGRVKGSRKKRPRPTSSSAPKQETPTSTLALREQEPLNIVIPRTPPNESKESLSSAMKSAENEFKIGDLVELTGLKVGCKNGRSGYVYGKKEESERFHIALLDSEGKEEEDYVAILPWNLKLIYASKDAKETSGETNGFNSQVAIPNEKTPVRSHVEQTTVQDFQIGERVRLQGFEMETMNENEGYVYGKNKDRVYVSLTSSNEDYVSIRPQNLLRIGRNKGAENVEDSPAIHHVNSTDGTGDNLAETVHRDSNSDANEHSDEANNSITEEGIMFDATNVRDDDKQEEQLNMVDTIGEDVDDMPEDESYKQSLMKDFDATSTTVDEADDQSGTQYLESVDDEADNDDEPQEHSLLNWDCSRILDKSERSDASDDDSKVEDDVPEAEMDVSVLSSIVPAVQALDSSGSSVGAFSVAEKRFCQVLKDYGGKNENMLEYSKEQDQCLVIICDHTADEDDDDWSEVSMSDRSYVIDLNSQMEQRNALRQEELLEMAFAEFAKIQKGRKANLDRTSEEIFLSIHTRVVADKSKGLQERDDARDRRLKHYLASVEHQNY